MKTLLLILTFVISVAIVRGDRDTTSAIPRAIASPNGAYFMLLVPVSDRRINWMWTVYAMGKTGAFREVWSTDGLYFRELFLADDGQHVACVESWPIGHKPQNDIVLAIYREGTLVKQYRPTELVRDASKIRHSSSHYRWLADWPPIFVRGTTLYFTTIENDSYELDMPTGKVALIAR